MRGFLVGPLLVLGLLFAPGGSAGLTTKTWVTGAISQLGPKSIAVKGAITVSLPGRTGTVTKSTLDGIRTLRCSREGSALDLHAYHVGSHVKVVCSDGVLSRIIRAPG